MCDHNPKGFMSLGWIIDGITMNLLVIKETKEKSSLTITFLTKFKIEMFFFTKGQFKDIRGRNTLIIL